MQDKTNTTSIKQLFQGMQVENMALLEGTVVNTNPFFIKLTNDTLEIHSDITTIPQSLSDYNVQCDIVTDSYNIKNGTITIHNGLKKGDKVILLSYNGGKQYYVLDRVV